MLLIGYIFSVVIQKNEYDRWFLPNQWFMNFIRGLTVACKSLFGVLIPKKRKVSAGDSKFGNVSTIMADEAIAYAKVKMIEEGIIYPDAYIHRAFDCENFAQAMKHYVDVFLSRNYGVKGLGFPTTVVGYDKDKGGGHAVLQIRIDGIPKWYNPYPNYDTFNGIELSINEISSISSVING